MFDYVYMHTFVAVSIVNVDLKAVISKRVQYIFFWYLNDIFQGIVLKLSEKAVYSASHCS